MAVRVIRIKGIIYINSRPKWVNFVLSLSKLIKESQCNYE